MGDIKFGDLQRICSKLDSEERGMVSNMAASHARYARLRQWAATNWGKTESEVDASVDGSLAREFCKSKGAA